MNFRLLVCFSLLLLSSDSFCGNQQRCESSRLTGISHFLNNHTIKVAGLITYWVCTNTVCQGAVALLQEAAQTIPSEPVIFLGLQAMSQGLDSVCMDDTRMIVAKKSLEESSWGACIGDGCSSINTFK